MERGSSYRILPGSARAAARAASAKMGSEPVFGVQGPRRHAVAVFGPSGVRQLPRGGVGGVSPIPAAGAGEHTAHES